ncbi:HlyD family secretion protein, partial [Chloroflexota bacterium]
RIVTTLLLCLVLVGSISCNPLDSKEPEPPQQPVEQEDLTVTVSGSGNIEVSNEMKSTFGVAGKVDEIYVEEGDEVSEGEVLAKLETDALELALTEAQVALNEAQVAENKTKVAVTQAEISLRNANIDLEETQDKYTLQDIRSVQAEVLVAKRDLEEAFISLSTKYPGSSGEEVGQKKVIQAQSRLDTAEDKLDAMLSDFDTEKIAIKKLQVEVAEQSLAIAQQSLEPAWQSVELARQSLKLAQKRLDEATITAPFDGAVARVDVDEKDTVSTTTTIVHLIDPKSMELNVEVDEVDIAEVKLGQRAIIEIDALPDLPLEGMVSSISLLPTIETGLVMYDVKIEFDVPEGTVLRAGMSATADIVIAE